MKGEETSEGGLSPGGGAGWNRGQGTAFPGNSSCGAQAAAGGPRVPALRRPLELRVGLDLDATLGAQNFPLFISIFRPSKPLWPGLQRVRFSFYAL